MGFRQLRHAAELDSGKAKARHAIRDTLAAHLETLTALGKPVAPRAHVALLQYRAEAPTQKERLRFVGIGAILGKSRSRAKSAAARRNGALGGRPRKPARA